MMRTVNMAECSDNEPILLWISRHPGPWLVLVWAPALLAAPVIDTGFAGAWLRIALLAAVGAAFAAAARAAFLPGEGRRATAELWFILQLTLSSAYLVLERADYNFLLPLVAISAGVAVRRRWAMVVIGAVALGGGLLVVAFAGSSDTALSLAIATFLSGLGNFVVQYLVSLINELVETRGQLAASVVEEERLRFARDLHDLLGHTLSLIVVKAEAVRRLVPRDPLVAADHAADIETIGRNALAEVRQAVSGYRSQATLAAELETARVALLAREVDVRISAPEAEPAPDVDGTFAWVVREGVTNVLRHSNASECCIEVTWDRSAAHLVVRDNGNMSKHGDGNGLRGLRERLDSRGGVLSTSSGLDGYRLAASMPIHAAAGPR